MPAPYIRTVKVNYLSDMCHRRDVGIFSPNSQLHHNVIDVPYPDAEIK
jgi:hypothetical protein